MSGKTLFIVGLILLIGSALVLALPTPAVADPFVPTVTINTTSSRELSNSEVYSGLKLTVLVSSLVFLPSLLMTATCFTRVAIVLSLTRQALGTGQTPPNQILMGLALFLTVAIMQPVFQIIWHDAIVPYSEDQIGHEEAFQKAFDPLREFMLAHTRESDLQLFTDIANAHKNSESPSQKKLSGDNEPRERQAQPESPNVESLGATVVIPAFVVSELNTAFQIAFLIYLPFLILDMIISSVLTSMSMITLPPTVISLPIKMMLFVIIDGWHLIIGNLVKSYAT